jgi:hypothetical protein
MNSPPERKSIKVSKGVHSRVYEVADSLGASAHEAIRILTDPSTVCLPLSTPQHERWNAYAEAAGIPLAAWIEQRVEAAIQYGSDPGTMHLVLDTVRALAREAGVTVRRSTPRTKPKESP